MQTACRTRYHAAIKNGQYKHNLNAHAIGSLKDETLQIEEDVSDLINQMNRSTQKTEHFIEMLQVESDLSTLKKVQTEVMVA